MAGRGVCCVCRCDQETERSDSVHCLSVMVVIEELQPYRWTRSGSDLPQRGGSAVGVEGDVDFVGGLVTVGVADFVDDRAAPLADAGMAFPPDLAGVVTVGVAHLADAGMVTVGVTDVADTAPVDGDGVDTGCGDRLSTRVWYRWRTPVRNDLQSVC